VVVALLSLVCFPWCFLLWVFSAFPSFWFVVALYVAWAFFTWVYFLLELFFFFTRHPAESDYTVVLPPANPAASPPLIRHRAENLTTPQCSLQPTQPLHPLAQDTYGPRRPAYKNVGPVYFRRPTRCPGGGEWSRLLYTSCLSILEAAG
jgi:hypothetical protein